MSPEILLEEEDLGGTGCYRHTEEEYVGGIG